MAGEIVAARTKIKTKLDITAADTTFDAMLLECIEQAVPRLAPYIQLELAADTSITLATDADSFTLPVAGSTIKKLYVRTTTDGPYAEAEIWRKHATTVYISDVIGTTTYVKILAERPYANSDADFALLATNVPAALLPLYMFAMAEFYSMVVGNKRKFGIYQQINGSRTLQEMADLVTFYEGRAKEILEDEISAEGQ